MNQEIDRITQAYENRKQFGLPANKAAAGYSKNIREEREIIYATILRSKFGTLEGKKILEIGAGGGSNIDFFKTTGFADSAIYANELLADRFNELRINYPEINVYPGNALDIESGDEYFDVVFQSTVFTSITDDTLKRDLAKKMWALTKKGGIILWYDFIYDNPANKDVKGVSRKEIKTLFSQAKGIKFYKTTLAPPIGRRFVKLYKVLNFFSFLRTHVIAVIEKD